MHAKPSGDEAAVKGGEMHVYLCGTRGSTPAPGADFLRYGGHTSCVALSLCGEDPSLVLDAGTGLRQLTPLLDGDPFHGTILLTHLHWDHLHGLPFFRGGDRDDSVVDLLIPEQLDGSSAEAALERGISPPHFPIVPRQLRGRWSFAGLPEGTYEFGPFTVLAREIPHKGGRTFGYRVSSGTSAIAYMPDHCPTVLGHGPEGWGEYHEAALALADGVTALLHDAVLLPDEVPSQAQFGHAAGEYAVELARRAKAESVILFHHRHDRTDDELDEIAARFASSDIPVTLAADGTVLEL